MYNESGTNNSLADESAGLLAESVLQGGGAGEGPLVELGSSKRVHFLIQLLQNSGELVDTRL